MKVAVADVWPNSAICSGDVHVTTLTPGFMAPNVKAGKAKVIAVVSGSKRSPLMPDVPTFAEQGYDLDFRNWLALYFPRDTPDDIARRWNAEVNKVLSAPGFTDKHFAPLAVSPTGGTPEELAAFARRNRQTGAELAKIANLKLD